MKCNGTYLLWVQTRHGAFAFRNQRFYSAREGSSAFLHASDACASAVTRSLQSLVVWMCLNTPSYEKARQALAKVTGNSLLARQTLSNWAASTAERVSQRLTATVSAVGQTPLPEVAAAVDVYDPAVAERTLFADGILVKAQTPTHQKRGSEKVVKACPFHQASFGLLPDADGTYQFVYGTGDERVPLSTAMGAFACQQGQETADPLPVVALTDGAKDLRCVLAEAFGTHLPIILDGYHLRKKVCELASMLVATKEARTQLKQSLLRPLFDGRVAEAQQIVAALPVKNAAMHQRLTAYLSNHAHEIIDYRRRQQAGKPIGSGRMEKGVDQVVGLRQKDKGMSWSKSGSYALALLTAAHANGQLEPLWNRVAAA